MPLFTFSSLRRQHLQAAHSVELSLHLRVLTKQPENGEGRELPPVQHTGLVYVAFFRPSLNDNTQEQEKATKLGRKWGAEKDSCKSTAPLRYFTISHSSPLLMGKFAMQASLSVESDGRRGNVEIVPSAR